MKYPVVEQLHLVIFGHSSILSILKDRMTGCYIQPGRLLNRADLLLFYLISFESMM